MLQLLKIPGFGSKGEGEDDEVFDFNEEMGALADKDAMDDLVKDLMNQNEQFKIDMGNDSKIFEYRKDDPVFTVSGQKIPNPH